MFIDCLSYVIWENFVKFSKRMCILIFLPATYIEDQIYLIQSNFSCLYTLRKLINLESNRYIKYIFTHATKFTKSPVSTRVNTRTKLRFPDRSNGEPTGIVAFSRQLGTHVANFWIFPGVYTWPPLLIRLASSSIVSTSILATALLLSARKIERWLVGCLQALR